MTTLFIINALSRVSLSQQLEAGNPASRSLRPELAIKGAIDETFIGGKELYDERNSSSPFTRAHYQQYKYATAWALGDTGQYISLGILFAHVFLALVHTVVLFWARRSSVAWGSINELMVLAYNSAARPGAFKNCSSGVAKSRTKAKKVRVGTRTLEDGSIQAELVVCDDEGGAGDVVADRAYS